MKEFLFMEAAPNQHLVPCDPHTAELIDTNLRIGERYKVKITSDRRRGELNWYWAGLGLLLDNLPDHDRLRWPTTTALSIMLLEALGHTHREYFLDYHSTNGVGWREVADSIAMDSMDEQDFKIFFENARSIAVARWAFDPWEIWREERQQRKGSW